MNTTEFLDFIESNHKKRIRLLESPKKKRASDDDRFENFYRFAEMENVFPAYTPLTKCNKQFLDIMDIVHYNSPDEVDLKYLTEMINDVHNYLDFCLGIAKECAGKED